VAAEFEAAHHQRQAEATQPPDSNRQGLHQTQCGSIGFHPMVLGIPSTDYRPERHKERGLKTGRALATPDRALNDAARPMRRIAEECPCRF